MFINIRDRKWLTEADEDIRLFTPWAVVLNFRLFMHLSGNNRFGSEAYFILHTRIMHSIEPP